MTTALARREYELQIHRAYLRAMRAVVRREERPAVDVRAQLEAELLEVEAGLAALPDDPARPMVALASALALDADTIELVWAAVALAANPPMRVHAVELDERASYGLTLTLYCRMVELPPDRARALGLTFIADHPLVRRGLLHVGHGDRVTAAWTLAPARELVAHLAGLPRQDPDCAPLTAPAEVIHDAAQAAAITAIAEPLATGAPLVLFVEGAALTGRRTAVALASARPTLAIELARAPSALALAAQLRALRRETLLHGAVPVVFGVDELAAGEGSRDERAPLITQFLDDTDGPVVVISTRAGLDLGTRSPSVRVTWPVPDVATRERLWQAHGADAEAAQQLATRFPLGAGAIRRAVDSARLLHVGRAHLRLTELLGGVRHNIAEKLGTLADRVAVKQGWADLVLADDVMAQVRGLVARVRHAHVVYEQWGYRSKMPRGVGVAALFSGQPGTGKTMVAGLIAAELELDLYQVDLSKVVSKWVGETEKQLAMIFDAAEAGHALLLFDEADALFGQRTSDVQGANDRYANLEVNFLLQRIERFGGVVILTTNLDTAIDKALKRRLAAHIVFPQPDDDERAQLWQRLLATDGAPLGDDLDYDALAQAYPKMSGANIRNAALAAAFLAAADGRGAIDQDTVMTAGRGEYLSMGQVLSSLPRR
ncbi:MAG: ATP-binding protein [Kofleriaceae bacterium]